MLEINISEYSEFLKSFRVSLLKSGIFMSTNIFYVCTYTFYNARVGNSQSSGRNSCLLLATFTSRMNAIPLLQLSGAVKKRGCIISSSFLLVSPIPQCAASFCRKHKKEGEGGGKGGLGLTDRCPY